MALLTGKKTYLVALVMLAYAIAGLYLGKMETGPGMQLILEALGLAGLRNAIATK